MKDDLFFADDDCMAGVVASLVPGDDIETLAQDIDDLSLPLVTPLGAYNNDIGHDNSLFDGWSMTAQDASPILTRRRIAQVRLLAIVSFAPV